MRKFLKRLEKKSAGEYLLWNNIIFFKVNYKADKFDEDRSNIFLYVTASLLYLMKNSRLDLKPLVSFQITQLSKGDEDVCKKMMIGLVWVNNTIEDKRVIG